MQFKATWLDVPRECFSTCKMYSPCSDRKIECTFLQSESFLTTDEKEGVQNSVSG